MNQEETREKIITQLKIEKLDPEKQDEVIDKVNVALLQRIFVKTTDRLSEEDRNTLVEKVNDEAMTEEDIDVFLREAIEEYDAFLADTVNEFFVDMDKFVGSMLEGGEGTEEK